MLDGTLKSFDFSALLNSIDVLFIFTGHISHAVYEKAIAAACQRQTKYYYINATNLDIIAAQMSRYLLQETQHKMNGGIPFAKRTHTIHPARAVCGSPAGVLPAAHRVLARRGAPVRAGY
mgnify:CR=1 FL=1